MSKTLSELIDSLITVSMKLWHAQEIVTKSQDDLEVAVHARKAQNLNAQRNKLMRSIDEIAGQLGDSPSEKTYG